MISVENITKYYDNFLAVDNLTFDIEEGHVYGFLGPNGAGKSTTMNIITGCLSASAGKVTIGGHDILEEPEAAKRLIGYLPEQPPLYMNDTPVDYLQFVGEAKGLKGKELINQIKEVINKTGIDKVKFQLISTLSKGYKQRVGIAQALMGNPKVIILDEPTVGLDPIQIIEIRDLIKSLGENHTVIFSSHILSEVQAICEKVLIISKGKLVAYDTPENLEKLMKESNEIYLSCIGKEKDIRAAMEKLDNIGKWTIQNIHNGAVNIHIQAYTRDNQKLGCRIFNTFAEKKLPIFEMYSKRANLEDIFIELTDRSESDLDENYKETPTEEDLELNEEVENK